MSDKECIQTVPLSFSLSLPFPLKHDEIKENRAQAFLGEFCLSTAKRLLIQHEGELIAVHSRIPVDGNAESWRFLLPKQKTLDYDGLCRVEVALELFLFEGETVDALRRCIAEVCYRVCFQTLLFSRNSGCALSFALCGAVTRRQLDSQWKNHVLLVDEEHSKLRYFHYDPNALPFYKQLFIAILIPLIIYVYTLIKPWSRRS